MRKKNWPKALLCIPAAAALAHGVGGRYWLADFAVLLALLLMALYRLDSEGFTPRRSQLWAAGLFSCLLAASLVCGSHLHIEDPYSGLATDNYFEPFSAWDLVMYFCMVGGLMLLFLALLHWLSRCVEKNTAPDYTQSVVRSRYFRLLWLALFLAWLPYLLRYTPGTISTDSQTSLAQALGLERLSNRHPLILALVLRLCLFAGGAFSGGDMTPGCLLYTVMQMLYLSGSIAYLVEWLVRRFRLTPVWRLFLGAVFAVDPYMAINAIAMWKDPCFAASFVLWTLSLTDLCFSKGELLHSRGWRLRFVLFGLLTLFWRNNGVASAVFLAGVLALWLLVSRKCEQRIRRRLRQTLALTLAVLLIWAGTVRFGYRAAGIPNAPREESVGVMLNQMAAVAATGGRMDEQERDYLESLMPLEVYAEAYRPCSVDLLKWDARMNTEALASKRFFTTWLSLLWKNPGRYLSAWALNCYGFWTVNRAEIREQAAGIEYPVTLNFPPYTLREEPLLPGGPLRELPLYSRSLPAGVLAWLLLAVVLLLVLTRRTSLLLPLSLSVGLILGLLVGTPLWYLPRYALPVQFLAPYYLLLAWKGK